MSLSSPLWVSKQAVTHNLTQSTLKQRKGTGCKKDFENCVQNRIRSIFIHRFQIEETVLKQRPLMLLTRQAEMYCYKVHKYVELHSSYG